MAVKKSAMKAILLFPAVAALMLLGSLNLPGAEPTVLVYTRNYTKDGKGFVHDNIAASVAMLKKLGQENGFAVEVSDQPGVFTDSNLKKYQALIFSNSNNEAFANEDQRAAFKRYIQGGGGFVGIHSASGSERDWPYFWDVLGGKFNRHSPRQNMSLKVVDAKHPATRHLPAVWKWNDDESYYLDNLNPDIHVLLASDLTVIKDSQLDKYPGKVFGGRFPLAWCHEFDGGRQFYTALGHQIAHYSDLDFQKHVLGGIQWVLTGKK